MENNVNKKEKESKIKKQIVEILDQLDSLRSLVESTTYYVDKLNELTDFEGYDSEIDYRKSLLYKDHELRDMKVRSVHILNGMEYDRKIVFRAVHNLSCNNKNHFIYDIEETALGNKVKIKCPVCGVEESLTDVFS